MLVTILRVTYHIYMPAATLRRQRDLDCDEGSVTWRERWRQAHNRNLGRLIIALAKKENAARLQRLLTVSLGAVRRYGQ